MNRIIAIAAAATIATTMTVAGALATDSHINGSTPAITNGATTPTVKAETAAAAKATTGKIDSGAKVGTQVQAGADKAKAEAAKPGNAAAVKDQAGKEHTGKEQVKPVTGTPPAVPSAPAKVQ